MVKKSKKETYRVTLDFSPESRDYVEHLQELTGCATKAELFKQALNVLDFVSTEMTNGARILVKHGDHTTEAVFPLMVKRRGSMKRK